LWPGWASQGPNIAFMAEYDALPGIGHGCGHNLMAAVAVGAGVAISRVCPPDEVSASWLVLGTPAEETIGGKVVMVENGVFDDIDAAFIAHPGQRNGVGGEYTGLPILWRSPSTAEPLTQAATLKRGSTPLMPASLPISQLET
jgi:metal-dependent amidase/aminoacylase/carboxypeptidase family protein